MTNERSLLLDALLALGIEDCFAQQLAGEPTFATTPTETWIAGLEAAAHLINREITTGNWAAFPSPWATICPILAINGVDPGTAILNAPLPYGIDLRVALAITVADVARGQTAKGNKQRPQTHTKKVPSSQASATKQSGALLRPIDENLVKAIQAVLARKTTAERNYKQAGEILLDWLVGKGEFIKTARNTRHYLYKPTHRLYSFDTAAWHLWLYLLTSVNPAAKAFKYFLNDCEIANAELGKEVDVVRVACWDDIQQTLRVSRYDGVVYRLDGMTIEEEANGNGPVIFDDAPFWTPYTPDYSANGSVLDWSIHEIPNWDSGRDECSLVYRAWWLATFFTELCPTRPILVMKGGKGSGKSMSLRILLRLLFGLGADVVGVPDRADSFIALTSNSHVVALDNMDDPAQDIRDKIASLSTGKIDQLRRLYTTNESVTVHYRCWLAVTSRSPDTLQRDDLVDRTIIVPVKRIEDADRTRESYFLTEVIKRRNQWWGDILLALNSVVREIRQNGIPQRSGLRMEDWASLGTVMARAVGQEGIWETSLNEVKARQAAFLLDSNVVVEAIEAWLTSSSYTPLYIQTRFLFEQSKAALFGVDRPDVDWPRSVKSFGRELAGIQRELQEHLMRSGITMRWRKQKGYEVYQFVK